MNVNYSQLFVSDKENNSDNLIVNKHQYALAIMHIREKAHFRPCQGYFKGTENGENIIVKCKFF